MVILKLANLFEGDPNYPFSLAITSSCRVGATPFPWLLHFTFDPYLIMLSVKQVGIKYYFLSLWYDWTSFSRTFGEQLIRPMARFTFSITVLGALARWELLSSEYDFKAIEMKKLSNFCFTSFNSQVYLPVK